MRGLPGLWVVVLVHCSAKVPKLVLDSLRTGFCCLSYHQDLLSSGVVWHAKINAVAIVDSWLLLGYPKKLLEGLVRELCSFLQFLRVDLIQEHLVDEGLLVGHFLEFRLIEA